MSFFPSTPPSLPAKILVVEDEAIIASQMVALLATWGYEDSDWVPSGQEALKRVAYFPPDLILAGVHLLGNMDGVELIGRIRTRWSIPVVLISGFEKSAIPPSIIMTPGIHYVEKPYLPFQLKQAINQCLT